MEPNSTQDVDVSAGGNVKISTIVRAAAGDVAVETDPTSLVPTYGRVVEDAADGTLYVGDGAQWLDVDAAVGLEGEYPVTGTYTGDGVTTGRTISLGYEPQYVTIHRTGGAVEMIHVPSSEANADVVEGGSLTTSISVSSSVYAVADGIMVGDGDATGNANAETYRYEAW